MWRSPLLASAIYKLIEHEATKPDEKQIERRRWMESQGARYRPSKGRKLDVDQALLAWIGHIAYLAGLCDTGWSPGLDDLRPEEWDGLRMWRAAQDRLQGEYVGCPGCGRAMRRTAKMHGCGWRAD